MEIIMMLVTKLISFLCVLGIAIGANQVLAAQQGTGGVFLASNPQVKMDFECYSMDSYPNATWSKYSWCTNIAPNSNVYFVRNWIQVSTSGIVCSTGAPYSQSASVYSEIPTNSGSPALSAIWHNTVNYSHNSALLGAFQVWWTMTAPLATVNTNNPYTASSSCP